MPPRSMTGFGRSEGKSDSRFWVWEVRTVNGRGLDVRFRLPPGLDALEPQLRDTVQKRLGRGSINATLVAQQSTVVQTLKLNEAVLDDLLRAVEVVRARVGGPMPGVEALIGQRGLIEAVEAVDDEHATSRRHEAMLASFHEALDAVIASRAEEGQRLATVIADQLDAIERLVAIAAASPARSPEAIALRLKDQVARILQASGSMLDPARLHQEAVIMATRADIEEELKRLGSHVAAARALLAADEPIGRKFDFLTQEFNREANTLCSKSNDTEITRAGLELKTVIDQMREQVQNIE